MICVKPHSSRQLTVTSSSLSINQSIKSHFQPPSVRFDTAHSLLIDTRQRLDTKNVDINSLRLKQWRHEMLRADNWEICLFDLLLDCKRMSVRFVWSTRRGWSVPETLKELKRIIWRQERICLQCYFSRSIDLKQYAVWRK